MIFLSLDYIIHSYRATCPLNLEYFPMDKQMCTLEIESFGYTMSGTVAKLNKKTRVKKTNYHKISSGG